MVKSLNDAYGKQEFTYMTTCMKEINDPNSHMNVNAQPEDVLTAQEKDLYDSYVCCGDANLLEYIIRMVDGTSGVGLNMNYCEEWCEDLLEQNGISPDNAPDFMPTLFKAVERTVKEFIEPLMPKETTVYVGNDTTAGVHEVMVFIPYALRDKVAAIRAFLTKNDSTICYMTAAWFQHEVNPL